MKFDLIPCRGVLVYSSPDNHVNYLISDFISISKSFLFFPVGFKWFFCFLFLPCLIFFPFLVELLVGHCPTCPGGCYATVKWGTMYPFKCLKEFIQMRFFFQTINDGLSLLIPIHSCGKWKTNRPISKKCSEAKIHRCHFQNQPYLENCLCYKHDLGANLKLSLKWFT